MLKKRGSVSAAIRQLIHGPEPVKPLLPPMADLLHMADEVTMDGVRFIRDDTLPRPPVDIRRWQNHPVIQTEAACDLRSLVWVVRSA